MKRLCLFALLLLSSPALAGSSVCEADLVHNVVIWHAESRSPNLSEGEFDSAREEIAWFSEHIFPEVNRPRIFEVTRRGTGLLEDYARAVFRTSAAQWVRALGDWENRSLEAEWLGYYALRALMLRRDFLQRETGILNDLLSRSEQDSRAAIYFAWKNDLEQELTAVNTEISNVEQRLEVDLPFEVLKRAQGFFVDLVYVLGAQDNHQWRERLEEFESKADTLQKARVLLAARELRHMTFESAKADVVRVSLNALLQASDEIIERGIHRPVGEGDAFFAAFKHQLRIYHRRIWNPFSFFDVGRNR